jgi:hypothetical protein
VKHPTYLSPFVSRETFIFEADRFEVDRNVSRETFIDSIRHSDSRTQAYCCVIGSLKITKNGVKIVKII